MPKARLQIPCPVCIDEGITKNVNSARIIKWRHATDEGALFLDETATIYCDNCSHTWFIGDSRWGCRDHSDGDELDYRSASPEATAIAVAKASYQLRTQMTAWWFQQLLDKLDW